MPLDYIPSACPHDCPSTCALEVERLDARTIGRVRGAASNSYTAGVICAKVARYAERQHHPARLATPMRRVGAKGEGRFQPIGWEDALDLVAEQFLGAARRYGSETVWPYYYAGTMGLVQRDGINRLRHIMRYSGQHSTFCITLADAGWTAGVGVKRGTDSREMAESDLIVVWGGNPVSTQVNVMTHVARARKTRGAKLVVIDVYRTPTVEAADLALLLRPGTDAALACAVMQVCFAEGYADRDYLARYTDVPDELEAHLATRTPEWAAPITGLSAEAIRDFARLYGRTSRSFIRVGYGFSRSRNGAVQLHAVTCLPAVTGAWRHRGGGALYSGAALYKRVDRTLLEATDHIDPSIRVLDQSRIGAVLTGDPRDLQGGPPVTAMLVQNTNPMVVAPDSLTVRAGLAREDLFTCVHEQFLTETAAMADVVLPATTFLEHHDLYTSSGHTHLHVTRPVVEPYAESRSNHEVIAGLARRLGAPEHPGFTLGARDLIDATLARSGLPAADDFDEGGRWIDMGLDFDATHFLSGFGHADGKFRFKPDWSQIGPDWRGLPTLPDQAALIDGATAAKPYRLVAAPSRSFLNSTFNNTPSSVAREGRPTALLHPETMAALGMPEKVRLGHETASVVVHARAFDGVLPGTVVVEGLWPNAAFEEGVGINALTSAEPGKPNGGGVFHDTAIWVRAV